MTTTKFRKELQCLVNTHSLENISNTPDWIIAGYLARCLNVLDEAIQQRETWYGRDGRPTEKETAKESKGPTMTSSS